jgi:hypothetical protein
MLYSKLLRAKSLFKLSTGESIIDLVRSTFNFGVSTSTMGPTVVGEYEAMRPDLVSEKLYSDQSYWDVLLKFNGISNPFSIDYGEILLAPSTNTLEKLVVPPKEVVEHGTEPAKKNEDALIKPKTTKDVNRLASIRTKVSEVLPPNVNLSGAQNVKVVNGKVILGGDMTQTGSNNINQAATRARVQAQLKNTNNF